MHELISLSRTLCDEVTWLKMLWAKRCLRRYPLVSTRDHSNPLQHQWIFSMRKVVDGDTGLLQEAREARSATSSAGLDHPLWPQLGEQRSVNRFMSESRTQRSRCAPRRKGQVCPRLRGFTYVSLHVSRGCLWPNLTAPCYTKHKILRLSKKARIFQSFVTCIPVITTILLCREGVSFTILHFTDLRERACISTYVIMFTSSLLSWRKPPFLPRCFVVSSVPPFCLVSLYLMTKAISYQGGKRTSFTHTNAERELMQIIVVIMADLNEREEATNIIYQRV